MITATIIAATTAYLIGSIPTGFLVARFKGVDIRSKGSGNIGATNVFRTLGKTAGILVLIADALKGYLGCLAGPLVASLFVETRDPSGGEAVREYLLIVGALAAILGHNYTCWLRFKGGKGIATSAGALVALLPQPFLISLTVWITVFVLGRYVSLASIAAAAVLPVGTWLTGGSPRMIVVSLIMGGMAIYKHKSNIQRLLNGTENRFERRARPRNPAGEDQP